jgi:hypothetical protein
MSTTTTGFATEFITFSRDSLATVTDSDGLIKWAPHNLLLASEQFDNTNWTKSSATVAANADEAPNGTDTADTITASGANGTALQSYTAEAVPYTFGVWLKRKTGTGTIEIAADNGTYVAKTITSDWALHTVTQTPAAGSKSAGIRIVTSADEVYAWGAHLYRSDLGGMQANASAYPYYNPSTPKNLLGYSEAFATSGPWFTDDVTIASSIAVAPNGSLTADSITDNTVPSAHLIVQSVAVAAGTYTFSIYAKAPTSTSVTFQVAFGSAASGRANFNLPAGSVGSDDHTSSITPVGDGWFRCAVTVAPTAGTLEIYLAIVTSSTAARLEVFSGTGERTLLLWGAQLSDSASLDPYSPVFGAAPSAAAYHGPRLDYDPVTLAAKGLLVEETRTNLYLNSETPATQVATLTSGSTYTISMTGGSNVVDLDETIAVTAVDVFVYDTSKDSDGGAWRTGALAQASSWYNETLNTATRGSRREFPAVAVIVAESTKVTIYDGDDPSLPMWMVFNGGIGRPIYNQAILTITAKNGELLAGQTNSGGLAHVSFVSDYAYLRTINANEYNARLLIEMLGLLM